MYTKARWRRLAQCRGGSWLVPGWLVGWLVWGWLVWGAKGDGLNRKWWMNQAAAWMFCEAKSYERSWKRTWHRSWKSMVGRYTKIVGEHIPVIQSHGSYGVWTIAIISKYDIQYTLPETKLKDKIPLRFRPIFKGEMLLSWRDSWPVTNSQLMNLQTSIFWAAGPDLPRFSCCFLPLEKKGTNDHI